MRCESCKKELSVQEVARGFCPHCGESVSREEKRPGQSTLSPSIDESFGLGEGTASVQFGLLAGMEAPKPVSAEALLADVNVRQTINPEFVARKDRGVLMSAITGNQLDRSVLLDDDVSLDSKPDIEEPREQSMDAGLYKESIVTPSSGGGSPSPTSSFTADRTRITDDEQGENSVSSWQGKSHLGAESNLVIQQRSVTVSPENEPEQRIRSDYQLIEPLGKGGMGTVWKARQYSVGRTVAVKMIHPEKAHQKQARERFLSEAVITGDLDHPNIVPVHELGKFESKELFYSMRRVSGEPWDKILMGKKKTLSENLEIWYSLCDAIAFAHSRGIIHRDIKPENVMVGEFGEVLVMDWGLALALPSFKKVQMIQQSFNSGGSPAYMAPEMARQVADQVGTWSDIYLLGASLYEVVTGEPPHPGRKVSECLQNARNNVITPFTQPGRKGELVKIAVKAMSTDTKERYKTVQELQAAVRRCEAHQESLTLSENASVAMNRGIEFKDYKEFNRAIFGYEEALNRWDANPSAKAGVGEAKIAYAECALKNGDYDLGLSLLENRNPQHQPMIQKLKAGKQERETRAAQVRNRTRIIAGLFVLLGLGGTAAALIVGNYARELNNKKVALENSITAEKKAAEAALKAKAEAEAAEKVAVAKRKEAEEAKVAEEKAKNDLASKNTELAQSIEVQKKLTAAEKAAKELEKIATAKAKKAAEDEKLAKEAAVVAQKKAEEEQKKAEMAQRAAEIAAAAEKKANEDLAKATFRRNLDLARAQIGENNFDAARDTLKILEADVFKVVREEKQTKEALKILTDSANSGFSALSGNVGLQRVAVSPTGGVFATGGLDGKVQLWTLNEQGKPTLSGAAHEHRAGRDSKGFAPPITGLSFSGDGKWLASSAVTRFVRVWNVDDPKAEPITLEHADQVHTIKFSPKKDSKLLLTVSGTTGQMLVEVWNLANPKAPAELVGKGETRSEVYDGFDAAWSPDESFIVTAGVDRRVIVWQRGQAKSRAAEVHSPGEAYAVAVSPDGTQVASAGRDGVVHLWTVAAAKAEFAKANAGVPSVPTVELSSHLVPVRALAWSSNGGNLVSAAEDNTLKLWNVQTRTLEKTMRGHSNVVTSAAFVPAKLRVVSVGLDSQVRVWNIPEYREIDDKKLIEIIGRADTKAHDADIRAVALDAKGEKAVTAAGDRMAVLWNTANGARLAVFKEGHGPLVDQVILFDGGKKLLTAASLDQSVCLWDVARGVELQRLEGRGTASAVAISGDGKWLGTASVSNTLELWDLDEVLKAPKGEARPARSIELLGGVNGIAFSADGRQVAVFTDTDGAPGQVFDLASGKPAWTFRLPAHQGEIQDTFSAIAFLPKGRIAAACSSGVAVVYGPPAEAGSVGEALQTFKPEGQSLVALAATPDGKWLVTAGQLSSDSGGPQISLWDLAASKPQSEPSRALGIQAEIGIVTAVAISNDGKTIVASATRPNGQQDVLRWTGTKLVPESLSALGKLPIATLTVALSPDGSKVVTGGGDEARLWDWKAAPQMAQSFRAQRSMRSAELSADGKYLITGDREGVVKVWDTATRLCIAKQTLHRDSVNNLMFSPDDPALLVSASDDGTAVLWTWDAASGALQLKAKLDDAAGHTRAVTRARFSGDGMHVVTSCLDGSVRTWSLDGKMEHRYQHGSPVVAADLTGDGSIAVLADSARVQLVDLATSRKLLFQPIAGHGRELTDVRVAGQELDKNGRIESVQVVTGSLDGTSKVWDVAVISIADPKAEGRFEATELLTYGRRGRTAGVTALGVTRDGRAIVSGHQDGQRLVWRAPEEK